MSTKKCIVQVMAFCLTASLSFGQSKVNYGLTSPQDVSMLPKSAVPFDKPVRKAKVESATMLQPTQNNEWKISGGWELAEASKVVAADQWLFSTHFNTSNWYNATVPGTVLTTLVDQGVYPDPYFGLNNLSIPDSLCRIDWWYRTTFNVPSGSENKLIWLLFNGINYKADIWLNGKQLGSIRGAFTRGEFNATSLLKRDSENILAVHILPPPNPGIPHEASPRSGRGPNGGQLCLDGPTFISSEGWDWVPGIRDRNIGIWQDVLLRVTNDVTIIDPQVITDLALPDTTNASLLIKAELVNNSSKSKKVEVTGFIGEISFSQNVDLSPNQRKLIAFSPDQFPQLKIKNPRLWWPNGYGKPELYTFKLAVTDPNNTISDSKTTRFGIRELSYELTVDTPEKKDWRVEFNPISALKDGKPLFDNINRRDVGKGVNVPKLRNGVNPSLFTELQDKGTAPYLVIKVNGKRIFCRGGNWGMDDGMKRVSRKLLEPYFKLHHDAHFNMVRNWTGESTEEVFYELCDEYGLLVWNDFWLSTESSNLNVNNDNLFLDNAREVIHRFRNHPSIAIWCPRNEGYAPPYIEERLATMIAIDDGTRHYQPNSRYLNLEPSGPWHYFDDAADYFRKNARGFNTELGTPSLPTAASMRKMMPKEDVWPISETWYYHDMNFSQKEYCHAIDTLYGKSNSLEEFCKKAQMVNYNSHRAMFESWNSKLWNSTCGVLLWMTHPAWPSTVWQVYSWDYETFGSYYGVKKACEPVHIQMNLHDNKVVVINTTLQSYVQLMAQLEIFDLKGKKVFSKIMKTNAPANQLTECFQAELPKELPSPYLLRVILKDEKLVLSQNEYWKTSGGNGTFTGINNLGNATILAHHMTVGNDQLKFEIANSGKIPAISLKLNLRDPQTGKLILPAIFSDGYFTLLPGEKKQILVEYDNTKQKNVELLVEGYNLISKNVFTINSNEKSIKN